MQHLCSGFCSKSIICDTCAADLIVCLPNKMPKSAFATPVQRILCQKQHLRHLCSGFATPVQHPCSGFATLVQRIWCQNQHLRHLCSGFGARISICFEPDVHSTARPRARTHSIAQVSQMRCTGVANADLGTKIRCAGVANTDFGTKSAAQVSQMLILASVGVKRRLNPLHRYRKWQFWHQIRCTGVANGDFGLF